MKGRDACFSSKRGDWETPDEMFAELDREFRFTLDAAADAGNRKCQRFFSEQEDGLKKSWKDERV